MGYEPHSVSNTEELLGEEVLVVGHNFAVRGEVLYLYDVEKGFLLGDMMGFTYNFTESQMKDKDIQIYVNK